MRSFLLLIATMLSLAVFSQPGQDTTRLNPRYTDSLVRATQQRTDSMLREEIRQTDSAANERNLNSLLRLQKENNAKQKKAAITRIAIGVALLGILIFGLMRRRKLKK